MLYVTTDENHTSLPIVVSEHRHQLKLFPISLTYNYFNMKNRPFHLTIHPKR